MSNMASSSASGREPPDAPRRPTTVTAAAGAAAGAAATTGPRVTSLIAVTAGTAMSNVAEADGPTTDMGAAAAGTPHVDAGAVRLDMLRISFCCAKYGPYVGWLSSSRSKTSLMDTIPSTRPVAASMHTSRCTRCVASRVMTVASVSARVQV